MGTLSSYLKKLEGFESPSHSAILAARIPKLLTKIGQLDRIPRDNEFHFKERVMSLNENWTEILKNANASDLHNLKSFGSSIVQSPPKNPSESRGVTEKCPFDIVLGSDRSREPDSDQRTTINTAPDDRQLSSHTATQHPNSPESQPVVIDLTDKNDVTESELLTMHSTRNDAIRSVQKIKCSPPSSTSECVSIYLQPILTCYRL